MKYKYFTYSIILLPLSIFFIIETYIYTISEKLVFTNALIASRKSNIQCLIMGDSHLQNGFRNNLKNCYNLSIGGSSLPMIQDAVNSVYDNNDLKMIILPLEPHDFSTYRQQNYSPIFKDISKTFNIMYQPLFNILPVKEEIQDYIKNNKKEDLWPNWSIREKEKRVEERINIHGNLKNFEKSNYSINYIKFIENLIKKNIKVYLVRTPVTYKYNKKMFEVLDSNRWERYTKEFTSMGAIYIDFKKLNFNNSEDIYFVDEDHLNEKGSFLYTRLLKEHIKY
ncbi:hypothetical protein [Arcobacter arenosus]|uniref:SGNH/GDSL hydrolase family protein n=1 Tax=Arcobacter arenosus TaxID=2576037 RepID=A0A5R8Y087_9BACT|nr:hypothetical protein [Arcobacter arenosus]TLP37804.1 hypothetical protein FDK22_10865 [Arcobacter arenosus]